MDAKNSKLGAYAEGAKYVSRRMRTEKEVIKHLLDLDFTEDEAAGVVHSLKSDGYINDEEYAVLFLANAFQKGRSLNRAKRELNTLGVDEFSIEDALYRLETEENHITSITGRIILSEEERANEVMLKILEKSGYSISEKVPKKIYARIARNLAGKGYNSTVIYKVCSKINQDNTF